MKLCVFGGQYGSEGKGSAAEYLIKSSRHLGQDGKPDRRLVALGENSPNSGHTCSLGKTRNIPASSYFADTVILGPDSAIQLSVLADDLANIKSVTGKAPRVYIHEHAALVYETDGHDEADAGVVMRISSTGSGSGIARVGKNFYRYENRVIGLIKRSHPVFEAYEVVVVNRQQYLKLVEEIQYEDCIFECSQGTLLDVNWGVYPFVTSRSTIPRTVLDRNGLSTLQWAFCGVYRTYPIRTGGPSGPTGGKEVTFESLGLEPEIATVTKRKRRIFEFSRDDFYLSIHLTRPSLVFFTHLDYIHADPDVPQHFFKWYDSAMSSPLQWRVEGLFLSNKTGEFTNHGVATL